MFGTEDRPVESQIAASTEVYGYIIFHGSDIKDLQVRTAQIPRPQPPPCFYSSVSPLSLPSPSPAPTLLSSSVCHYCAREKCLRDVALRQVFENPNGGKELPRVQAPATCTPV